MDNPIVQFNRWWQQAVLDSPLQQKSALCVSTLDEHGFPASRFVDLKAASDRGFIFCTYLDSAKGQQLKRNPNTAMTAWWDHLGYQVRIVGQSQPISAADADHFWATRSKSAQLTTTAFAQSAPLASEAALTTQMQQAAEQFASQPVPRPANWGGFCVRPLSIEFLTFRESRLHLRELFVRHGSTWQKQLLQP